jgi:hypothetical protein
MSPPDQSDTGAGSFFVRRNPVEIQVSFAHPYEKITLMNNECRGDSESHPSKNRRILKIARPEREEDLHRRTDVPAFFDESARKNRAYPERSG